MVFDSHLALFVILSIETKIICHEDQETLKSNIKQDYKYFKAEHRSIKNVDHNHNLWNLKICRRLSVDCLKLRFEY